jgi:hypothetical protein
MKSSVFLRIINIGILLIFGLIIFHAPITVWLSTLIPDHALLIKAWKEVLMLTISICLIIFVAVRKDIKRFLSDKLIYISLIYIALHLIMAVVLKGDKQQLIAGLMIDLRYIVFFILVYITVQYAPNIRRYILLIFGGASITSIFFALLQIFILPKDFLANIGYGKNTIEPYLTVDRNNNFIRINGTLRGPNPLGALTVIWAIFTCVFAAMHRRFTHQKWWIFFGLYISLAIILWASYSRSAVIGIIAALISAVIFWHGLRLPRSFWIISGLVTVFTLFILIFARDSHFLQTVVFHNDPAEGNIVNSDEGHITSLRDGSVRMLKQPLGAGIGSTGSASYFSEQPVVIENQYLLIAHEVGWLGLSLFFIIIGIIFHRLILICKKDWLAMSVLASGVGLLFIGILLPVFVDDTVSILWWGLAGLALGHKVKKTKKS